MHAVHPNIARLHIRGQGEVGVHPHGQVATGNRGPVEDDPGSGCALTEREAVVLVEGLVLDDHRVAFLARPVRPIGDGERNAWIADDLRAAELGDHLHKASLEPGDRGSGGRGGGGRGLERFEPGGAFLRRDGSGGDLGHNFTA